VNKNPGYIRDPQLVHNVRRMLLNTGLTALALCSHLHRATSSVNSVDVSRQAVGSHWQDVLCDGLVSTQQQQQVPDDSVSVRPALRCVSVGCIDRPV